MIVTRLIFDHAFFYILKLVQSPTYWPQSNVGIRPSTSWIRPCLWLTDCLCRGLAEEAQRSTECQLSVGYRRCTWRATHLAVSGSTLLAIDWSHVASGKHRQLFAILLCSGLSSPSSSSCICIPQSQSPSPRSLFQVFLGRHLPLWLWLVRIMLLIFDLTYLSSSRVASSITQLTVVLCFIQLCSGLLFSPAALVSCCPHPFIQFSFPVVLWWTSSSAPCGIHWSATNHSFPSSALFCAAGSNFLQLYL